jgi:hypothetical protein
MPECRFLVFRFKDRKSIDIASSKRRLIIIGVWPIRIVYISIGTSIIHLVALSWRENGHTSRSSTTWTFEGVREPIDGARRCVRQKL